tara:strand:+ start:427 stop:600 length:174 start_codon:yes stop_codon:yes gene_type:complete
MRPSVCFVTLNWLCSRHELVLTLVEVEPFISPPILGNRSLTLASLLKIMSFFLRAAS